MSLGGLCLPFEIFFRTEVVVVSETTTTSVMEQISVYTLTLLMPKKELENDKMNRVAGRAVS